MYLLTFTFILCPHTGKKKKKNCINNFVKIKCYVKMAFEVYRSRKVATWFPAGGAVLTDSRHPAEVAVEKWEQRGDRGVGGIPGHLQQVMERLAWKWKKGGDGCRDVVVGETGGFMSPSSQTWLLQSRYENITTKTTAVGWPLWVTVVVALYEIIYFVYFWIFNLKLVLGFYILNNSLRFDVPTWESLANDELTGRSNG